MKGCDEQQPQQQAQQQQLRVVPVVGCVAHSARCVAPVTRHATDLARRAAPETRCGRERTLVATLYLDLEASVVDTIAEHMRRVGTGYG